MDGTTLDGKTVKVNEAQERVLVEVVDPAVFWGSRGGGRDRW